MKRSNRYFSVFLVQSVLTSLCVGVKVYWVAAFIALQAIFSAIMTVQAENEEQ